MAVPSTKGRIGSSGFAGFTLASAEAWIRTQVMERVHAAVAESAWLPESQVTVRNHLIGGGFGRRLEPDMAFTAAPERSGCGSLSGVVLRMVPFRP